MASLLINNLFTKNTYKENLKTIFDRENNKEVRKINSFDSNYGILINNISDHYNVLTNNNISHQDYFENDVHVNKIIPVLIFMMFR